MHVHWGSAHVDSVLWYPLWPSVRVSPCLATPSLLPVHSHPTQNPRTRNLKCESNKRYTYLKIAKNLNLKSDLWKSFFKRSKIEFKLAVPKVKVVTSNIKVQYQYAFACCCWIGFFSPLSWCQIWYGMLWRHTWIAYKIYRFFQTLEGKFRRASYFELFIVKNSPEVWISAWVL